MCTMRINDATNIISREERIVWHVLNSRILHLSIKIRDIQEQIDEIKDPSRIVLKRRNQRPIYTQEQLRTIEQLKKTRETLRIQKETLISIVELKTDEIQWRYRKIRPDIEQNLSEQFEQKIKALPPFTDGERECVIRMYCL